MPSLPDLQFIAARASLLDLAAFMDRVQRHDQHDDYRLAALLSELLSRMGWILIRLHL